MYRSWPLRRRGRRGTTLSDVNRFERLLAYSNQPYRYRNRFFADYAFGKRHVEHLFTSNEFFVNLSEESWNQNRAQVGAGILVNRATRFDAYFLQRTAPGGKETSVIGTVLTIMIQKGSVRRAARSQHAGVPAQISFRTLLRVITVPRTWVPVFTTDLNRA